MDSDTLANLSREELVSRVQQAEQVVSMDVYLSCGNAIGTSFMWFAVHFRRRGLSLQLQ